MISVHGPDGSVVEFPEDTPPEKIQAVMAQHFGAPSGGEQATQGGGLVKKAGAFLGGMQDSAFETLGMLPDMSARATNALGLTNTPENYYSNAIKSGWNKISRALGTEPESFKPETTGEKFLYGAGRGAADAATIATGAGAVAGASRAGSITQQVAQALAAQPAMQAAAGGVGQGVGEATGNPYLGIAASLAVPAAVSAAGRVVTPVRSQLDPQRQRLADVLAQEGVDLTAGQRTGSRALQGIESVFPNLPFTGRAAAEQAGNQQRQFNRAVLSRAGINADNAAPEVIDGAFRRLGGDFNRLSNGVTLDLGSDDFQNALGEVVARYSRKLPSQTREVFQNYVDDIAGLNGQMPGTTYQVTRSDLTKQARAAAQSDPTFSEALRGLRNALDDAAERAVPEANRGEWQDVRRQYANLKTISKAATGGGQAGAAGDIAPAQLYGAVKQGVGADQFARGQGDLNQLARAGQAFLRPLPNSTTAERTFWQNLMTGSWPGAAAGGLMGGAPGAVAGAAATLAGPRLAQMAYNSRPMQAYLSNQAFMPDGISPRLAAALLAAEEKRRLAGP
jgi:hypothetical protein